MLRGDEEVGKQCSLTAPPPTLVDADGIVAKQFVGKVSIEQLEAQITSVGRITNVRRPVYIHW